MQHLMCERLKYYMKKTGTTPAMMAEAIGETVSDVLDYQTGDKEPDMETMVKMSHILSTSTDELLVFED